MDFTTIFGTYLMVFTTSFGFLPIFQCLDWKRRGTSEGFSGVNFVLMMLIMACWLKYWAMVGDTMQICMNAFMIVMMSFYMLVYYFYQPNKATVHWQVGVTCAVYGGILRYVDRMRTAAARIAAMGSISASAQTLSMGGQVYEIYRVVFLLHTTEYLPAFMTFGGFLLGAQWMAFGLLTGDIYMVYANIAGVVLGAITISLYVFYPPLTWRVPILGTGPSGEHGDKKTKRND